ncbi:NAD-dependent epimerase [Chitinophaga pinensis]|uniref:NAD-dependent epimerase/dehydratase n=1 Tax=Chitinophaga pinensis (strain ATCC 43595 / DSM 2588 / LMG 13176 / NBRC 15968 / NCIMB 11800 / UQM 2034) TaxID=485918 RepID=A0A979GNN2_CHIPD|nr:NAD-dependent epimerase [Chitinophaga pinensis]ACU58578.1 NAD-dependent epimerase/dehydratase [Chitinophaga pinensis DSM 2588]
MKILVTGAAGFIGYYATKRLAELNFEVVGLDNINEYYDINLKHARLAEAGIDKNKIAYNELILSDKYKNYRFVKLNLDDQENLAALFRNEQFDVVCNLAAQPGVRYSLENPFVYVNSNVVGFMNILECCRYNKVKHLVYASSSSVYGMSKKVPFEETDNVDNPVSLYAATKKANELFAHTYSHLYGLKTTGLRFFTVYGPWGRPDMAPFLFTNAILKGEAIKVFNNGELSRDFTYVDDVVEGVIRVIMLPDNEKEQKDSGEAQGEFSGLYKIFNIGNSSPVQLMDFIRCIEKATGKEAILKMLPMQPGDVVSTYADTSELAAYVNYRPSTPLQDGIDRFVSWFKEYSSKAHQY